MAGYTVRHGRAKRGGGGALNLQSAIAGLNPDSRRTSCTIRRHAPVLSVGTFATERRRTPPGPEGSNGKSFPRVPKSSRQERVAT